MGVMDIGASALRTAYTRLQTTSHNIANASTPGYTRQEAIVETGRSTFSGSGFLGGGVDVKTVERVYSDHLTRELNAATAQHAADDARVQSLARLDQVFADPQTGIGASYDSFTASLADMVNRPFDESARTVALQRANDLAQSLNATDGTLVTIGEDSARQAGQTVNQLNTRLAELAQVNDRIARSAGSTHAPNDLLDQRDLLIEQINGSLKVSTYINDDQTASVFASTGDALVLKADVAVLGLDHDLRDPDRLRLTVKMGDNALPLKDELITGGALAGQLQFHNEDLRAARARLGQIAGAIAQGYNDQQAVGLDAQGNPGSRLFTIGQGQAVAAANNTGGAQLAVDMVDGRALKPSDYQLARTDTGYSLTRLADGEITTFATLPDQFDGVSFALTGTMAVGDTFAVQTGSAFASGFKLAMGSPDEWATAYPSIPTVGANNQGSVSVSHFEMTGPDADAASPVTISFDADGTLALTGLSTGAQTGIAWAPGEPIEVNGWSITLTGTPAPGDTVAIAPTRDLAADNRNARALLGLAQDGLVDGRPTSEAVGAMVGEVGTRNQSAQSRLTQSASWQVSAQSARDEISGVNLDEEAARLLQYQQSYQAAAKVIAAAQSMFDSLLSIAR